MLAGRSGRSFSWWVILLAAMPWLSAGCTEFSHFGQISDRESTWAVYGVQIAQQQPDGHWKRIGQTDGTGRWNIFKSLITGGGNIRLSKPGYRTLIMSESDFLQQNLILMESTGELSNRSLTEQG